MLVPCCVRFGFNGPEHRVGQIRVNDRVIGLEAGFCGSYHILEMRQHYRQYIATNTLLAFPPCVGLPLAHPYVELGHKVRATGVFGNIGETVTGLVGRRIFGGSRNEIIHIRPKRKLRSPDFMMRIGPQPRALLQPIWPVQPAPPVPAWWPVEAKARASLNAVQTAIESEAFLQLAAFWHATHVAYPNDVGYGIAVGFAYEVNVRVEIVIFTPLNSQGLLAHMQSLAYADFLLGLENGSDIQTRGYINGC